ncbi:hypothetical protein [Azospirillum palustre]
MVWGQVVWRAWRFPSAAGYNRQSLFKYLIVYRKMGKNAEVKRQLRIDRYFQRNRYRFWPADGGRIQRSARSGMYRQLY